MGEDRGGWGEDRGGWGRTGVGGVRTEVEVQFLPEWSIKGLPLRSISRLFIIALATYTLSWVKLRDVTDRMFPVNDRTSLTSHVATTQRHTMHTHTHTHTHRHTHTRTQTHTHTHNASLNSHISTSTCPLHTFIHH